MDRDRQHRIFWSAGVKKEKRRELNLEKRVHTDEVWLEIEPFLSPEMKILDAGGGYGRYALPIAKKGCQVTLLDISAAMLREAKKLAYQENLNTITFCEGKVQNLSQFADQSFDMVLCLDAPISYAYPDHLQAVKELCRVCREKLFLSVVNRLGQLPIALELETKWGNSIKNSRSFLENGNWDHPAVFQRVEEKIPFLSRFVFPPLHAFLPEEIIDILIKENYQPLRVVASGSLVRLLSPLTLRKIYKNQETYRSFLNLCREYDSQIEVLGVGARSASGLFIVAERNHHGTNLEKTDPPIETGRG